ncbi:MAG: biotin/lipoyl-containing protein [Fusobacteriaceae bacterium]
MKIKAYRIKVGEKTYEVEVEELSSAEPIKNAEKINSEQKNINKSLHEIKSPVQGVIVGIKVEAKQKIKVGEVVALIEAMKMESPIVSPVEGIIEQIFITKGSAVEEGTLLITIK